MTLRLKVSCQLAEVSKLLLFAECEINNDDNRDDDDDNDDDDSFIDDSEAPTFAPYFEPPDPYLAQIQAEDTVSSEDDQIYVPPRQRVRNPFIDDEAVECDN